MFFIQNHDQIGNRAFGDRLHHGIGLASWRAVTALWLLLPETPLLFMGQEWAASAPFCYFTDHEAGLGARVTAGRRLEFGRFAAFSDPAVRDTIPDPQRQETFRASRLDWDERDRPPHAAVLALYRRLLALRRTEPAMRETSRESFGIEPLDSGTLVVRRQAASGDALLAVVRLQGSGRGNLASLPFARPATGRRWELVTTTEEAAFAPDARPVLVETDQTAVTFARPGAAIFRSARVPNDRSH